MGRLAADSLTCSPPAAMAAATATVVEGGTQAQTEGKRAVGSLGEGEMTGRPEGRKVEGGWGKGGRMVGPQAG